MQFTDNLSGFKCDQDNKLGCDDFIHKEDEAKLYQKERHGITYLFFCENDVVGYVTLAMSSIPAKRMDKRFKEPVRLKFYPSLLIGRLAISNDWRRKGIGKLQCGISRIKQNAMNTIQIRNLLTEIGESEIKIKSRRKRDFIPLHWHVLPSADKDVLQQQDTSKRTGFSFPSKERIQRGRNISNVYSCFCDRRH